MKHCRQLLILLLLLCSTSLLSLSADAKATKKVIKATSKIPSSWKKVATPSKKSIMSFDLYLTAPNRSGLHKKMTEISKSPKTAWLTSSQAAQYVTPSAASRAAVIAALKSAGVPSANLTWSTLKDRVTVTTTVKNVESFLSTTISSYSHNGETSMPKATSATLSADVSSYVYSVGTLLAFGSPSIMQENAKAVSDITLSKRRLMKTPEDGDHGDSLDKRATSPPSTCSSSGGHYYNYPRCLIDYYGLPQPSKSLSRRNDIAVVGYLAENFSQTDLSTAMKAFRTDQPNAAKYQMYLEDLLGATNAASDPTGEAALDAQIAVGMTYPLQSSYYNIGDKSGSTPGSDTGDIFLSAFQEFLELDSSARPSIITVSYGILDESAMTSTADAMCNAAQLLSALGTTVIFSSGDSGPDGTARSLSTPYPDNGGSCLPLIPSYPSGCPYILSVGATAGYYEAEQPVYYGTPSGISGYSWSWASGSGFSNHWATPDYQTSAVSKWSARSNALYSSASKGQYNSTGRAFPDVAALGIDYPVVINGGAYLQAGTSMSSPVFATILALLNNALLNAGQPTLGYVQPMFYANPSSFKDVTLGGSWWKCGPGTASTAQSYGFNATVGWDPASGLGSVNYTSLKTLYGL